MVRSPCRPRDSQKSFPTPQFKSISILWCSAFFLVQLSHPYLTTGKTIALTIWIFVSKVMSLLFKTLSRFEIAILPRRKGLVGSPCCPRDSQKSSPTPQFKNINSLAFSLLYGPTLTSGHDYWKNHNFEYMDLDQQSDVSAF